MLKIGIVGLPNVGKSSLFNALTKNDVLVANYPFATIEPNLGIVKVLDERVDELSKVLNTKKTIYSIVEFLDIAGLVKNASKGEGLGNKFLENIRSVNLILMVVRCFEGKEVVSVHEKIDPEFDSEIIIWELIYADIETIDKSLKKLKTNSELVPLLQKLKTNLNLGEPVSIQNLSIEEKEKIKGYQFLTEKKIFLLANINESESSKVLLNQLKNYASKKSLDVIEMNIQFEREIANWSADEVEKLKKEFNILESAINKLIYFSFQKLQLQTFFTAGPEEVRSWTFKKGKTIKECSGLIHTDLETGFIKAKIAKYQDFILDSNWKNLQNKGKVSIEGKNYLTQDGDIVLIEFKNLK